jgi:RND family efflux transporter MFP subunit
MSRAPAFASVVLAAILSLSAGFAQAQQPAAPALAAATPAPTPAAAAAAVPLPAPAAARSATPKPEAGMEMSALVMADNEATLSAQMAGKINRIRFAIGDGFPARAVLVEFDCAEPKARLDALNAEYLGARETHLAKLRLQGLGAAGDLEVTLAAAAGERAKSQVKQQEAQMSFCTILAPYAGRVVRLKARQAESVAPNQPVMEIVATARLKAAVHVPSALAVRLKQGSPLSIDIRESGRRYAAKVAKLNARVDGVSQSLELQVVFVGDTTGLLPGMIGQAVFVEDPGKSN